MPLAVYRYIFGNTPGKDIFRTDLFFIECLVLLRIRLIGGSGLTSSGFFGALISGTVLFRLDFEVSMVIFLGV